MDRLSEREWQRFDEQGYVVLEDRLRGEELSGLQRRIDEIMLHRADVPYDRMLMQLDSRDGSYEDAGEQSLGHKGRTLNYRKIQNLEHDPLFLEYMQRPIFAKACARIYGVGRAIAVFRAMFMNKPSKRGTFLPWHQDRWNTLDRDPLLTAWTALDPATRENGCVQVIPGSHRLGLINPEHHSGFLTPEQAERLCRQEDVVHLELEAGQVMLLHNWLLHASDGNRSAQSRRAFSVCYMDAATADRSAGAGYPVIFGPCPSPCS